MAYTASTIRPAPRLVRALVAGVLAALAATVCAFLVLPTIVFVAAVAILTALDWVASRRAAAPSVAREMPERTVKGRAIELVYRISLPAGAATVVALLAELPPDLGGDRLFDQIAVAGGQTVAIRCAAVPRRRGIRRLGPVLVAWRSPIGLLRIRRVALAGCDLAVLPQLTTPARQHSLTHRSVFAELGLRPKPLRGAGREFESLCEYVPGDDPRFVDWRASARRGRLIVRQFQPERRHTVMVAVDTGRLMAARSGADSKLDHAVECAVALARASAEFGDQVGLLGFDRELRVLVRPRSGRHGAGLLTQATLALEAQPFEPDYRVLVETLARAQSKRALIVVLTDLVEGGASRELEAWLRVLARWHCLMLVALRDRLLAELDERAPQIGLAGLHRRLALQDLAVEREAALGRIRRFGVQTLDLDPASITAPVLNRYLAIRQSGLL